MRVRLDATATSLARKGILVDLKIARERFELRLDAEDLGIKASESGYREFLDEYVRLGRRRLIPVRYLRTLDAVETNARRLLRESSFQTVWGRFVPYQVYNELSRRLEEMRDEYRRLNGRILENYDSIRLSTEMKYRDAAREVYRTLQKDPGASVPEDFVDNFVFRVMSRFPGRAEIGESCRFEIDLSFVPVTSTMAEMEARMASKAIFNFNHFSEDSLRSLFGSLLIHFPDNDLLPAPVDAEIDYDDENTMPIGLSVYIDVFDYRQANLTFSKRFVKLPQVRTLEQVVNVLQRVSDEAFKISEHLAAGSEFKITLCQHSTF